MRIDRLYSRAISVLIAFALFTSLTVAQTRSANDGSLELLVKDPSGAVINNARLQLSKDAKATQQHKQIKKAKLALAASLPVTLRYTSRRPASNHGTSTSPSFMRD